jgi:hypothetical protein
LAEKGAKGKMRKRMAKALMLLLAVSFAGFVETSYSDELLTETIYVMMFFTIPPVTGEISLKSNVGFEFKELNLTDLPLNFSVGDFEYLRTIKYEVVPWGAQGRGARITCTYNGNVLNDTAEEYTSIIASQMLTMFNQQQLDFFDNWRTKDSTTGELRIFRDYGYFPDSAIISILEHKPQGGFSELITGDFLNLYKRDDRMNVAHLEYTVYESSWDFNFDVTTTLPWNGTNDVINVDLNKMIASGPIAASPHMKSLVSMVLYKSYKKPDVTYSMNIESITPPNCTEREENEDILTLTYDLSLLGPIQINANVAVSTKHTEDLDNSLVILVGVTCAVVIAVLIAALLFAKKRKSVKERTK